MTIEDLNKTIENISKNQKIEKGVIIDDIIDILKIKYGEILLEKEKELVFELKNKIITRLYSFDDHSIPANHASKKEIYKADRLDMNFLEKAENELVAEGLLENDGQNLRLTNSGVLKYKSFYGEV